MKFMVSGAVRETGKQVERVIDAPTERSATAAAMDQGIIVARIAALPEVTPSPPAQRVQVVAGVWTIAAGVLLANAVLVVTALLIGFAAGVFDSFAR